VRRIAARGTFAARRQSHQAARNPERLLPHPDVLRRGAQIGGVRRLAFGLALAAIAAGARGEKDGLLYDPLPPANSAYVRIINAVPESAIEVTVDGRLRVRAIAPGDASDYLVLAAGKRTIAVGPPGKPAHASITLDVAAGRAMSLAFHELASAARPWIFEDRANTNKLKAVVAVYYLAGKGPALDVLTADGTTKVFSALAPGSSSGLSVNPITVDLVAAATGTSDTIARARVAMAPGGTYSVLFFPGSHGELAARAMINKVERYTAQPARAQ
jgi:alginate O-acetyltransferase complex protein AlgF